MNSTQIKQTVQHKLATGQTAEAIALCQEALRHNPQNIFCHSVLAKMAFDSDQLAEAEGHLLAALEIKPEAAVLRQNLGQLYLRRGDNRRAGRQFLAAFAGQHDQPSAADSGLMLVNALAPENPDLAGRLAAWLFAQQPLLAQAWNRPDVPPALRKLSAQGNDTLARQRFQQQWQVATEFIAGNDLAGRRLRGFLEFFHGLKPIQWAHPLQRPSYHFYPGLRAQPFYDLQAEWMASFSQYWQQIREEKNALLAAQAGIAPYVNESTPDDPDWKKLEKNLTWTSAHLLKGGQVNTDVASHCPHTMAALDRLPLARMAEHAPEAFFSILQPDTYIPPHFGLSNLKLTVHLGLDIPWDCAIAVGAEQRGWQAGEILVFDDSFRHEAWNRSSQDRAVLITEIWHPDLLPEECAALSAIMQEQAQYNQRLRQENWPLLAAEITQFLGTGDTSG